MNGYGNTQALIQSKELLKGGEKPALAIFAYNDFCLQRNAATSEISEYDAEGVANPRYPTAAISDPGAFTIKLLPLKQLKNFNPGTSRAR